jgi:hypothetical protein
MRRKLLGGAAALALIGCAAVATAGQASAQDWRYHRDGWGWGPAGLAAGVVGGAVAAATAPLWAPGYYDGYPRYAYGPGYADDDGPAYGPVGPAPGPGYVQQAPATVIAQAPGDDVAYCEAHFKSYNPASGTYLGYDGLRHACP